MDLRTTLVTAGRPPRTPDAPLNQPIVPASTFVAGGATEYGRYGNPSWSALEDAVGHAEGGHGITFSSGMAAAAAILGLVPSGGRLVLAETCYLGVSALVDREAAGRSITVQRVAVDPTTEVVAAASGADVLWLESPTNPLLEVADLSGIVDGCGPDGPLVVVDNTFASPVQQRPLALGADVVLHSATKLLSGHSDAVLGAVVCRDEDVRHRLWTARTLGGAVPGALETYLVLRGMRTLALRVEAASATARTLAGRLGAHARVGRVRDPGWGSLLAIELSGAEAADRFTAATRLWVNTTSLGGVESTLERRRRWDAELATVPTGLVRMSVGLEHVEDLWADLDQALARSVG